MLERNNIYFLNKKDKQAIVYEDADGNIVRLTREVFTSEDEFRRWKEWSDEEYHESEKAQHRDSNHTYSLEGLNEKVLATESVEEMLDRRHQEQERADLRRLLMNVFDVHLTPIQRRRLRLYCVDGLSEKAIAAAEGVKQQNISKAISAGKNKLKKFLAKQGVKTPSQRR
ncbi:MAG: sigma-70 family RNA polymerase sigma factor [Oscillospiraceae bacterium]|nr:sigma-70 family RNA polymerase sigma factor [Oscillospiraceae bacterium]